ncbi:MAG: hypothetical protein JWO07_649 [Candidatus Saccharibacteria bacterium]|nr:hypothetical protein [Candidatus Saccharibacteria bacterium]
MHLHFGPGLLVIASLVWSIGVCTPSKLWRFVTGLVLVLLVVVALMTMGSSWWVAVIAGAIACVGHMISPFALDRLSIWMAILDIRSLPTADASQINAAD